MEEFYSLWRASDGSATWVVMSSKTHEPVAAGSMAACIEFLASKHSIALTLSKLVQPASQGGALPANVQTPTPI